MKLSDLPWTKIVIVAVIISFAYLPHAALNYFNSKLATAMNEVRIVLSQTHELKDFFKP